MTRRTKLRDTLENPRLAPLSTTSNREGCPALVAVPQTEGHREAQVPARGGPMAQPEMFGGQSSRTRPASMSDAGHCQLAIVREDNALVLRR